MTASFATSRSSVPRHDGASTPNPPAVACLEVLRGMTQFPRRPFPVGRFLIGAAERCDVRLGGASMPALHSILQFDGSVGVIEAVAEFPVLKVNGQVRLTSQLQFGDVIEIGGVEFAVCAPEATETKQAMRAVQKETLETPTNEDELALRSAVELVELIEAEVLQIEDYQSRRQLGAEALLQAALRRANSGGSHDVESDDRPFVVDDLRRHVTRPAAPQIVAPLNPEMSEIEKPQRVAGDLEEIITRLDDFSEQLERRSKRLVEHEAGYLEASLELLKAQQKLADHLEMLHRQIESLDASQPGTLRASA